MTATYGDRAGGAVPPLIAPALAATFGTAAIGDLPAVSGVLSLVAVLALPETAGRPFDATTPRSSVGLG